MAEQIHYDDSNLRQLFVELEPERRLQAIKGGFKRVANQVRKTAINNLRSSGLRTDKDLERGVRAIVFKRAAGFRVTIGTKKNGKKKSRMDEVIAGRDSSNNWHNYHVNRRGQELPILIWAEEGTAQRRTKHKGKHRRGYTRKREQHSTGRMRRYGFMAQTLSGVRGTVTDDVHNMVMENVEKVAKKYGCK